MIEMMFPSHVQISGRIRNIMILSIIWTVVISAFAEQPPGFLSIDCGNTVQYQDSLTNLTWETDDKYVRTGKNEVTSLQELSPRGLGFTMDNNEALQTFRYFLEPQSKYCYELPLKTGNISVLIRAMFFHGNSAKLVLPTTFKVYVNGTLWTSLRFGFADETYLDPDLKRVIEGIFYSPGNIINFCLVPDQGVPFISSLELRQLDPEGVMYSFSSSKNLLLSTLVRYYLGSSESIESSPLLNDTVRYPDDAYDRLWNNGARHYVASGGIISSPQENANTSSKWNNVPPKVMMNALFESRADTAESQIPLYFTTPSIYAYAIFYCQAIDDTEKLNMVISMNDVHEETPPFNVTNIPVLKTFTNLFVTGDSIDFNVSSPTGFGAILNAMEIYEQILVNPSATSASDVTVINLLKETFNLSQWQGDPCVPIPYKWITCEAGLAGTESKNPFFITSLYLSNLTNSSKLVDLASFMDSTSLSGLSNISITYSHVDHTTLRSLSEILIANKSLDTVNFSYNSLVSLSTLTGLNDSNLGILDLSHNFISNDISSLLLGITYDSISSEIHLSDNLLTGVFSLDIIAQQFSDLQLLNLDRNNITGLLNLSYWYEQLQLAMSDNFYQQQYANDTSFNPPQYSFVDNNISAIFPNADDLQPVIDFLVKNSSNSNFNQSGVFLAGNPYCKDATSLTQRYLCRSTVNDIIYENVNPKKKKKKNKVVLKVFTTVGGAFLLIISFVILVIIWRLWQKLSITAKLLQEVQQELSSRKVQPVFYSYQELRMAAKGFHHHNRLGSGAFGDVYKGVFSDGSTVAIKRLFNANKKQVLHEFLSEVVLISGIKHKNLIQLKGCCLKDEERILVYEFAENGNLAEALWGPHKDADLNWTHRLNVALGVARGLSYLHEELQPRIIHRDIKAVNVLLDNNLNAKIADFGLAKPFAEDETQASFTAIAGTRGYFAPEYVMEGQLTAKADVFSFGILLLEIVIGRKCIDLALQKSKPNEVYLKSWAEDMQKSGTILELLQPQLKDTVSEAEFTAVINIALSCVRTNPKFRPTMSEVVIMLLGNLEVQNFWRGRGNSDEEADFRFDSLRVDTDMLSEMRGRTPEIMAEDSEVIPFLRSRSFPLSIRGKPRTGNAHSVQLSHLKR